MVVLRCHVGVELGDIEFVTLRVNSAAVTASVASAAIYPPAACAAAAAAASLYHQQPQQHARRLPDSAASGPAIIMIEVRCGDHLSDGGGHRMYKVERVVERRGAL